MKIDDVRIREVRNPAGKLKAVVSVTIDECFVVHDIKIFEREDGYAKTGMLSQCPAARQRTENIRILRIRSTQRPEKCCKVSFCRNISAFSLKIPSRPNRSWHKLDRSTHKKERKKAIKKRTRRVRFFLPLRKEEQR